MMSMSLSFSLVGDGMIQVLSSGSGGPPDYSSECGADFDEYTRRTLPEPFPFSSEREITNLWTGRSLKLHSNDKWREGKVRGWSQWSGGFFGTWSNWSIMIQFDNVDVGDHVQLQELKGAKRYNGKEGIVTKYDETKDLYTVELTDVHGDGTGKNFTVQQTHIQTPIELELYVKRMNIDGGGTVHALNTEDPPLLSLEWLEPASPMIDLNEGATIANCPTCRGVEPPSAAYQDATRTTETEQECPVCLETKTCRVLQCSHVVCEPCWTSWRRTSASGVSGVRVDDDEGNNAIAQERLERNKQHMSIFPHTLGGSATSPQDSQEKIERATADARRWIANYISRLLEDANGDEEGLDRFRKEIMVVSPKALFSEFGRKSLIHRLSIAGIEILLQVIEDRRDELDQCFDGHVSESELSDFFHVSLLSHCCTRIGEIYEEMKHYRGAIPWYERSLVHSQQVSGDGRSKALSLAYCNLGLAQKRAGFLSKALKNYNASLEQVRNDEVIENRKRLRREMEMWTGSSGKLTPGC